ncbi:MAG: F0F1 ATP synthase subunit gamma [Patescibacteria group bacterium]|nr:F0F1 ATP synthase subunit gamma [Patescibacteria group bacterium]
MATKKEVTEEFDRISTLKEVLETYEEIAAARMQNTRNSVFAGRLFIDELNYVFQQVKSSYRDEMLRRMRAKHTKDPSKLTFIERNGKTLYVLLSSNSGLYGEIVKKTTALFINLVKEEKADAAIIGRVGLELFKDAGILTTYNYFDFPDNKIDNEALRKIIEYILQYERTFIVYGRFENIITQKPIVTGISGDPLPQEQTKTKVKYFFEPSLDKIMKFFEAEIFSSLFEQTVFESQLAKFAARMTSLEQRVENIKDILKDVALEKEKIRHRIINKKQLETFSSMRLWSQNG